MWRAHISPSRPIIQTETTTSALNLSKIVSGRGSLSALPGQLFQATLIVMVRSTASLSLARWPKLTEKTEYYLRLIWNDFIHEKPQCDNPSAPKKSKTQLRTLDNLIHRSEAL